MRPIFIPTYIKQYWENDLSVVEKQEAIKKAYASLLKGPPDVSIVIPAYNEEEYILRTLLSLSNNITKFSVEIIVVNNNSTDKTEQIVRGSGVTCVNELEKGIAAARTAGLKAARGKYILNADADTIYPRDWAQLMAEPLERKEIAVTYGKFAFIPIGKTGRITYFFYEHFADFTRLFNKKLRDEAMNVYGFTSGYKRENGLSIGTFAHPVGAIEDGYMALKLRNAGFGKLHHVVNKNAFAWTTDRRLQADGGFWPAIRKRFKRVFFEKLRP
ncbi:MAG: glycosyltransferase family 2 protein [Bacteroidetes bacterium]|nr:glycosyltransferase family 2 protein [Bacteroidota bacterium]